MAVIELPRIGRCGQSDGDHSAVRGDQYAYLPDQRATRPIDQLSVTVWLGRVRRRSKPRSPTPLAAHDRTPSTTITRAGPAAARQHLSQADPRPVEYGGFAVEVWVTRITL